MSTQSEMTHSTHVAPSTMSLFLSPLSGSRWRMVFQISSSESISLSLVLFCLAFRAIPTYLFCLAFPAIPTYPCSFDVADGSLTQRDQAVVKPPSTECAVPVA